MLGPNILESSMYAAGVTWPRKTREIQTCLCDSTRWNFFKFRGDDIVVASYPKTGTTWLQQIVWQLIRPGDAGVAALEISPWLDERVLPLEQVLTMLEAQQHRRSLKTHLPLDALVYSSQAKYLYVARDGRDVVWSMYNHHSGYTPETYAVINNAFGRVGPPLEPPNPDIVGYFHEWLEGAEGMGLGATFWDHLRAWWDARHVPNLLLVHFNHLKADLPREIRRIANFLGIDIDEARWPEIVEHCSLDYMRKSAVESTLLQQVFSDGANTFFHKGTNGRWKDVLSAADLEAYDKAVKGHLTSECARWMATGEIVS